MVELFAKLPKNCPLPMIVHLAISFVLLAAYPQNNSSTI